MATDLNTTGPLVNTTTGEVHAFDPASAQATGAMSPTMKTYYDTELLENARPRLVFTQLGKSQFLPANHGDTVQWRKWNTFEKALTPLTEGVIPTGQRLGQSAIHVSVQQYGDYAAISDRLDLHAVDNVILGAAEEMGAACGETADTLVRNELCTGTSVMYCDTLDDDGNVVSTPVSRYELTAANNRLTPDMVNKAYTFLKKQKAPTFEGGKYVAVIHPSVTYDLRSSRDWLEVHKYAATREIFTGEIGELHGVRFIETTEAPVFAGENLLGDQVYGTVNAYTARDTTQSCEFGQVSGFKVTLRETTTQQQAQALVGRKLYVVHEGAVIAACEVVGATAATHQIWLTEPAPGQISANDLRYPGEGGNCVDGPCAVYGTLFFGKDAFGVVDPEGMGAEMIIKDRSQIGGPLNQFSTVGYKFETAARILYQNRMVRVESCSAYSGVDEAN